MTRKVVGQAVALSQGFYPDDGVHCRLIAEGDQFNVVEGLEKALWFRRLDEDKATPAAKAGKAKKSDADKEREQIKAEATPPDDIA